MQTNEDTKTGAFIEGDCTITHDGREFTADGAWLCQHKDTGKFAGVVYGHPAEHHGETSIVTDWHGNCIASAWFGPMFYGNMGDKRRNVRFTYQGKHFAGLWAGIDYNDSIRVREVR